MAGKHEVNIDNLMKISKFFKKDNTTSGGNYIEPIYIFFQFILIYFNRLQVLMCKEQTMHSERYKGYLQLEICSVYIWLFLFYIVPTDLILSVHFFFIKPTFRLKKKISKKIPAPKDQVGMALLH